jgi:sec-independent protein translocase protein TatB
MFSLDPAKLLLIGIVALVVLGPDKLPAAVQKLSSLLRDLQKMRTSLETEVKRTTGDLSFSEEFRNVREKLGQMTHSTDPRQALYRAAGLSTLRGSGPEQVEAKPEPDAVPGSIDLSALDLIRSPGERTTAEGTDAWPMAKTTSAGSLDPGPVSAGPVSADSSLN